MALRRCGEFALLVLAGLVVLLIELPWQAASLLFFLAALGYGVRALRACLRARIRGGVSLAMTLGLLASALMVLVEIGVLATWSSTSRSERCREQALTVAGLDACAATQRADLQKLVDGGLG